MPNGSGLRLSLGPSEWACAPIFQTLSVAPQPLGTVDVGKGCIVSRVGCNSHVSAWGVSYGLVVIICLVVMMTLGFSRSFSHSFSFLLVSLADLLCLMLLWSSILSRGFVLYLLIVLYLNLLCRIFYGIFTEVSSFILSLGPLRLYLFGFPSIGTTRR